MHCSDSHVRPAKIMMGCDRDKQRVETSVLVRDSYDLVESFLNFVYLTVIGKHNEFSHIDVSRYTKFQKKLYWSITFLMSNRYGLIYV